MISGSVTHPRRQRGRGTGKLEGESNIRFLSAKHSFKYSKLFFLVNASMPERCPVKEASSGAERRVVVDGGTG